MMQAVSQLPQFFGSFDVLSHAPPSPHWVLPEGHEELHAPATQLRPESHTLPHDPQFWLSVRTLVHFPSQPF